MEITPEQSPETISANRRIRQISWIILGVVIVFFIGLGSGYFMWGQDETAESKQQKELIALYEQVNPKEGYTLPISYGDLGPRLIENGVINYETFAAVQKNAGDPLSAEQTEVLMNGSDKEITIDPENAHFLLNFFWAVGLANNNSILTQGPMVQYSNGQVERFASTGGWTLASKPIKDLYASMDLISLTTEQQKLVEQVATAVYRPCCNNHTLFPDCNHGMAMLGVLELMASKGATTDQMFEAAKYINAYWFPQQTLEIATYLQLNNGMDFANADAKFVIGKELSSASGAAMVHEDLQKKGLLKQAPGQGGGCAN
ncbi:MAG TPA: hypothetical protein VK206_04820 [Anaerolineales bacterium]|nr:hypothetical protein [Anaerolineales bacterium]HLO30535.1 hypothetical protein [Anaerolineales bacterium]